MEIRPARKVLKNNEERGQVYSKEQTEALRNWFNNYQEKQNLEGGCALMQERFNAKISADNIKFLT